MDLDWPIVIARALTIAGAVAVLIGLAALAGLCVAYGGVALLSHYCDPTIPCSRCSANRLSLITAAHACVRPVTAHDAGRDGPR
jgi:hypothetical protein